MKNKAPDKRVSMLDVVCLAHRASCGLSGKPEENCETLECFVGCPFMKEEDGSG